MGVESFSVYFCFQTKIVLNKRATQSSDSSFLNYKLLNLFVSISQVSIIVSILLRNAENVD